MEILNNSDQVTSEMLDHLYMLIILFLDNDHQAINRVLICGEDSFQQTLLEVSGSGYYTETDIHKCVGKTVPLENKKSDIIIRDYIVQALFATVQLKDNKLSIDDDNALLVILHEIGHANTNFLSPHFEFQREYSWSKSFLKNLLNQYYLIERDEFLAQSFAFDKLLSKVQTDYKLDFYSDFQNEQSLLVDDVSRIKKDYRDSKDLKKLLFDSVNTIHYFLMRPLLDRASYIYSLQNRSIILNQIPYELIKEFLMLKYTNPEEFQNEYFQFWKDQMKEYFEISFNESSLNQTLQNCIRR